MRKKYFLLAAFCILLVGLERLYYRQNGGFSVAKVISSVPASIAPPSEEKLEAIDHLLDQPFRFLDSGGTSFVFLGEDGKTVLKLFKHQHLIASSVFFHLVLPSAFDAWRIEKILRREKRHLHKRQAFFFNSCTIAQQNLKEETGLIFLCLTPNAHFAKQIKLIDAWGIPHYVDLSRTEFALQKKADLLFPSLEKLLSDRTQAKKAIDSLVALIRKRCKQGIGDRDPNLLINFGFVEGKAVEFDLGSYYNNPALVTSFATAKELFFSTYALQKWLEKHSPELQEYLLQQIAVVNP